MLTGLFCLREKKEIVMCQKSQKSERSLFSLQNEQQIHISSATKEDDLRGSQTPMPYSAQNVSEVTRDCDSYRQEQKSFL